jgi:hypothetical protein
VPIIGQSSPGFLVHFIAHIDPLCISAIIHIGGGRIVTLQCMSIATVIQDIPGGRLFIGTGPIEQVMIIETDILPINGTKSTLVGIMISLDPIVRMSMDISRPRRERKEGQLILE